MKTSDLIDRIAAATGGSKADAKIALDTVVSTIVEAARSGDEVVLTGLGKFGVKSLPARQGRNPQTGEAIEIAASRKLAFAASKPVKDALAVQAKAAPAKGAGHVVPKGKKA